MPTGRVKFFGEKKGLGFIAGDDGTEVFFSGSAPPVGSHVEAGTRVEFSVVGIRRGPQALAMVLKAKVESLARKNRRKPEEMVVIIEDLIKILDKASNQLYHGRYPDGGRRIASALWRLADNFDAQRGCEPDAVGGQREGPVQGGRGGSRGFERRGESRGNR